jgi:hypothetical protein
MDAARELEYEPTKKKETQGCNQSGTCDVNCFLELRYCGCCGNCLRSLHGDLSSLCELGALCSLQLRGVPLFSLDYNPTLICLSASIKLKYHFMSNASLRFGALCGFPSVCHLATFSRHFDGISF